MKRILFTLIIATALLSCGSDANENAIPGLEPYDVTKNFEDNGFSFEKIKSEMGTSHTGIQKGEGFLFQVSTFSNDYKTIESITATVTLSEGKTAEVGKQFLTFTSTLPYDNSNPEQAAKWVQKKYDIQESDTIINGVKFSITAPSKFVRMLIMEKAK